MKTFLVVGAGLFGATFAHEAAIRGNNVIVIDRRSEIAGNIYTYKKCGVQVHKYGAHIFHTSDKHIWDYVNSFANFNRFTNSPIAKFYDETFNMPFNMNTFNQMWNVITPAEAKNKIAEQRLEMNGKKSENLEEQAISLVGRDIYMRNSLRVIPKSNGVKKRLSFQHL